MLITHCRPLKPPLTKNGKIIPTPAEGCFVAISTFKEGEQLKAAGFQWSRTVRIPGYPSAPGHWWTDDNAIAARLGVYCDERAARLVALT